MLRILLPKEGDSAGNHDGINAVKSNNSSDIFSEYITAFKVSDKDGRIVIMY